MKSYNFKKMILAAIFGLIALLSTSQFADAQGNGKNRGQRQKAEKPQKVKKQHWDSSYNRYRVYRNGSYYQTDNRGAELLRNAVRAGYQQGFRAGVNDRNGRRSNNYGNSSVYRSANYGYQSYVDSGQYQYYFQEGFQRGYYDGYNSRYRYGTSNNGSSNILGTILQGILNLQRY